MADIIICFSDSTFLLLRISSVGSAFLNIFCLCYVISARVVVRGKSNNTRDWAGLHDYLLEGVTEKLPLADCLSFGKVCKPWRSVTFRYLDKCGRFVPCFVKRRTNEVTTRSCFSILGNSNFEIHLPEARGSCIWGSFQDWLFLGRREEDILHISLLNPFSRKNISLPTATIWKYHSMIMSAVPSDEKCICVLIGKAGSVGFWTPQAIKLHEMMLMTKNILDAVYCKGCFYLLNDNDTISIINEKNVISVLNNERDGGVRILNQSLSIKLPVAAESQLARHYLVESGGEILLVCRFVYSENARFGVTSAFETYRLDLCKLAWLKFEMLDDQILFVGSCCSRSFHKKDFGVALDDKVYFVNEGLLTSYNEWFIFHPRAIDIDCWGVFNLQKPNDWPSVFQTRPRNFIGIWLSTPIGWYLEQIRGLALH